MALSKITASLSVFLFIAAAAAVAHSTKLSFDEKAYLVTTNAARAAAGVRPVVWNNTVADYARRWAKKRAVGCVFEHSDDGGYAENIATGCCDFSAENAVKMWVGEKKYYDPSTKKCVGGDECGHYANIIASATTGLGCARVKCDNDWIYMICDYWGLV